jgi:hypothetical protein
MSEVISGLANELVGAGIGTGIYSTSGTSVQINFRRDMGLAITHVLLTQTGGQSFPHKAKEQQGIQVLVDAPTLSGAQSTARAIYELWEEVIATQISGGHEILWLRAIAPPQALPTGPGGTEKERFQFSVNFDALIVKE